MPKINDLTTRPGGPQLTDEIWLASAGGAADFKTTMNALLTFLANNMAGINLPVQTFTPELQGTTANPSVTYGVRSGRYVRIGKLVQLELRLDWTALSGGSGNVRIAMPGLPNALAEEFSGGITASWFGITLPAGVTSITARPRPADNRLDVIGSGSGQSSAVNIGLSNLASSGRLAISGTYITN